MSKLDEIKKISDLLKDGFITQAEYDRLKQQILGTYVNNPLPTEVSNETNETISKESSIAEASRRFKEKVQESKSESENDEDAISQDVNKASASSTSNLSSQSIENESLEEDSPSNTNRNLLFALGATLAIILVSLFLFNYFNGSTKNPIENGSNNSNAASASNQAKQTDTIPSSQQVGNTGNPDQTKDANQYANDVANTMTRYYNAMSIGDFNANDYFSPNVEQFINLKNTTPAEINNSYKKSKSEFIDVHSEIIDSAVVFDRTQGEINYYKFKIN